MVHRARERVGYRGEGRAPLLTRVRAGRREGTGTAEEYLALGAGLGVAGRPTAAVPARERPAIPSVPGPRCGARRGGRHPVRAPGPGPGTVRPSAGAPVASPRSAGDFAARGLARARGLRRGRARGLRGRRGPIGPRPASLAGITSLCDLRRRCARPRVRGGLQRLGTGPSRAPPRVPRRWWSSGPRAAPGPRPRPARAMVQRAPVCSPCFADLRDRLRVPRRRSAWRWWGAPGRARGLRVRCTVRSAAPGSRWRWRRRALPCVGHGCCGGRCSGRPSRGAAGDPATGRGGPGARSHAGGGRAGWRAPSRAAPGGLAGARALHGARRWMPPRWRAGERGTLGTLEHPPRLGPLDEPEGRALQAGPLRPRSRMIAFWPAGARPVRAGCHPSRHRGARASLRTGAGRQRAARRGAGCSWIATARW